jgi:hypothetical protein
VAAADAIIGELMTSLRAGSLEDKVNLILTSTPGFAG